MKADRNALLIQGEDLETVIARLCEGLAVLESIEDGDMLAALPAALEARTAHQRAVCLLSVLRRDLAALADDLSVASTTAAMLAAAMARSRQAPKA